MSAPRVVKAIAALREATAEAAWVQWSSIFTVAGSGRKAQAIVDPEALLLVSIGLRAHEPRLWSAAVVWAQYGVGLMSVQRTKNLLPLFPATVREGLGEFAAMAVKNGDLRWRSLAGKVPARGKGRAKEGVRIVQGDGSLMLRMRLGFGVGIKADVLTLLIGIAGGRWTVGMIARDTSYQSRAVRRALEDLAAARFIETPPSSPIAYRAGPKAWADLLGLDASAPPTWRRWATLFAFVLVLDGWSRTLSGQTTYVLASEARDLVAKHGRDLDGAIRLPQLDWYKGEAYLLPFLDAVKACGEFLEVGV